MVISTQDSRGRGKVFEQITNFELQLGPQIPPDSAAIFWSGALLLWGPKFIALVPRITS